jgi:alpha-tubulin suppressor-like RCC1 family protein
MVSGISNATAISTGDYHTCALILDGTVQCWGGNTYGQLGDGTSTGPQTCYGAGCSTTPVMVSGISTATAISAGSEHTCALLSDGSVQCWGWNSDGQLGIGTNTGPQTCNSFGCSTTPVPASGISTAIAISAGGYHTCALLSDGTVQCWGSNSNGQLGNGSTTDSFIPVTVSGISTATTITTGKYHTCAILSGGAVQCWGRNAYGQLGDGSTTDSSIPVTIPLIGVTAISAGVAHTCALLSDDTVQCWGDNTYGQLGNGTIPKTFPPWVSSPVTVSGIATATAISAGGGHTCALLSDGTVQCWGGNDSGQLGNGTNTGSQACYPLVCSGIPVTVSGISTAIAISAGNEHTCAVLSDGTVQCWGENNAGQLGNGTNTGPQTCNSIPCSTTPVTVSGISTATAITAGYGHTCALLMGGTVQCWGPNFYGQLGNGSTTRSFTPVTVSGISTATAISAGDNHTCAILSGGTVQCWGYNGYGQLGDGTNTGPQTCHAASCSTTPVTVSGISTATTISAGYEHTCAVISDGTVQCWGENTYGQLGDGTYTGPQTCIGYACSTTPVTVSGIATATAISGGDAHTCALLSGGMAKCWGYNPFGQLGDGTYTGPQICNVIACSTTPVAVSGIVPLIVVWNSSNPWYGASINANGVAAGLNPGPTTITATSGGISGSTTLTVNPQTFTLSLTIAGTGSGTVSGAGTYTSGLTAVVSATANPGSTFVGWTGTNASECATGWVLMNANKSCTAYFRLNTLMPDLIVTKVTPNSSTVYQGGSLSVTDTVMNQGLSSTGVGFNIRYYLHSTVGVNVAIATVRSVAALAAGASSTATANLAIPATTPPNSYYLCAKADSGSAVLETNESNNTLCSSTLVTVPRPDLVITALTTAATSVPAGGSFVLSDTVINRGGSSASAFAIGFVLSPNNIIRDGDDIPMTPQRSIASLGVGASSAGTTTVTVPGGTAPGVYYIGAIADVNGTVTESREGNNTRVTVGTIAVTP